MSSVHIILRKHIEGLGEEGEIKKVKTGYARNFLIPKNLAVYKTPYSFARLQKEMEEILQKRKERYEATKNIIEKLKTFKIIFKEKVSSGGNLFRSIGKKEIFDEIYKQFPEEVEKYRLAKAKIHLAHSIKQLGDYLVEFAIYQNETVNLNISIIEFNSDEEVEISDSKE